MPECWVFSRLVYPWGFPTVVLLRLGDQERWNRTRSCGTIESVVCKSNHNDIECEMLARHDTRSAHLVRSLLSVNIGSREFAKVPDSLGDGMKVEPSGRAVAFEVRIM